MALGRPRPSSFETRTLGESKQGKQEREVNKLKEEYEIKLRRLDEKSKQNQPNKFSFLSYENFEVT